jgi:phenylacetate-CoA ligase
MQATELYQKSPICVQGVALNLYALRIHFHRYGRPFRRALRELGLSQNWSRDELTEFQNRRLREVVKTAYEKTKYYREVMDESGIAPDDIRSGEDLRKLPILTKEVVRSRGEDMLTGPKASRGWLHGHTSGTTGSPLSLWYDRKTAVATNAVDARHKQWGGLGPGDWIGLFLGRMIVSPTRTKPPFWQTNYFQRQVWFSSFHLSEEHLPSYVSEIQRRGLRFLEGYPSTLFILGRHLLQRGERLQMKAVFTSSETLHAIQREVIETAFGCSIHDFYGLAERVIFAGECEHHQGKHLSEEYGITEVVDQHGEPVPLGEPGALVGTSLHNEAMPLIRYQTSDVSAIRSEPCPCGRTLLRMEDVATKAEDIVVTAEGRMISPSVLTHPFKPFDQLEKSQVIQDRIDHLLVKLVSTGTFTPEQEAQLLASLRERVGPSMEIDVEYCREIPREASGKFRWVISHVDHDYRFGWNHQSSEQEPAGGKGE